MRLNKKYTLMTEGTKISFGIQALTYTLYGNPLVAVLTVMRFANYSAPCNPYFILLFGCCC